MSLLTWIALLCLLDLPPLLHTAGHVIPSSPDSAALSTPTSSTSSSPTLSTPSLISDSTPPPSSTSSRRARKSSSSPKHSSVVRDVLLVIFRSYAQHAQLEQTLATLLPSSTHRPFQNITTSPLPPTLWQVIPRFNPATPYPTDFLVVHVDTLDRGGTGVPTISSPDSALLSLPTLYPSVVKCVTRERQYRHLLSLDRRAPRPSPAPSPTPTPSLDPYTEFDVDPLNVGSFALPRRFSSASALSQSLPHFAATYPSDSLYNATPAAAASSLPTRQLYSRRLLGGVPSDGSVSRRYHSEVLWEKGYTGGGIKVAVFDTGLSVHHPHFRRIRERSNWTDNPTLDDELGHGTHVAGIIASQHSDCAGFAPDAELYVFRVFNTRQLSFTSWFLDAFNYAIHTRVHVLNLSIGGPDFHDRPFVDKVLEMSANRIVVVSAIGNDGPLYGTLNNPADQMDVIGVGGLNGDDSVAPFSSRGMTTWELPAGYGRVKPDVVAFANGVMGSKIQSGCKSQTGTSVASPVVAGAVALLASSIPVEKRAAELNPARLKQALTVGAKRVKGANVFEQGMGKLDLLAAFDHLQETAPHVSAIPPSLDLTDCPYMWPYCTQELFYTAMPVMMNVTLLNSISVASTIVEPPIFTAASSLLSTSSSLLSLSFLYSQPLWPWSGYLAIQLHVTADVTARTVVDGVISLTILSDDGTLSPLSIPLRVAVIPRPPRALRVLWDQFHNLRYPSGYFPRDNLEVKTDTLDWNGDHPHTNYRALYAHLRGAGYFVDVLGASLMCYDAEVYGVLLLVDSEDEFFPAEVVKLYGDVVERGLSVMVVGEWYNVQVMREVKFWDENTASWWTPETGGSNVPALNDLLAPFHVALSHHVVKGRVNVTGVSVPFYSGTTIARFPAGGRLLYATLQDAGSGSPTRPYPVMGLYEPRVGGGRVLVWGDSNCLDLNSNHEGFCTHFMSEAMLYLSPHTPPPASQPPALVSASVVQSVDYADATVGVLPERMAGNNLAKYSAVISPSASADCVSAFDMPMPKPSISLPMRFSTTGAAWRDQLRRKGGSTVMGSQDDEVGAVRGGTGAELKARHQYRTALTSVTLVLVLLLCVLLPSALLGLFHLYGADEGKRNAEERRGEGKQGRLGVGRPLWLWIARTAPSFCLTLLRLAHHAIMAQQAPAPVMSPPALLRGTSRQEAGPVIITDSE